MGGGVILIIVPVLYCYVPVKELMIRSHPLHIRGIRRYELCSRRDCPVKVPAKKVETDSHIFIPRQELQSPLDGGQARQLQKEGEER
jgi:hypothetical protein